MKKTLSIFGVLVLLVLTLVFSLVACSGVNEQETNVLSSADTSVPVTDTEFLEQTIEPQTESENLDSETNGSNVLVAYFSWADNAVVDGEVDVVSSPSVVSPGNVQQLAVWVQEETGGDLFSIQVTDPYPSDWDACLERANDERSQNVRPQLVENVENIEQYDTVFVGYPDWWSDAPMLIYSFIESYDWNGKTLIPFCTSGGSGFGRSLEKLPDSAPGANILEGLHVSGSSVESASDEIASWISGLNIS